MQMDEDMWLAIIQLLPLHFKVEFLDTIINTFAMEIDAHYEPTMLSGDIDDIYIRYYRQSKHSRDQLASYAAEFEAPTCKKGDWISYKVDNGQKCSRLMKMLQAKKLIFKGFCLHVNLHHIFSQELQYLAQTKKVIMYAMHLNIVE